MGSFCHHQRCARRHHRKRSYQEEKLKALLKSRSRFGRMMKAVSNSTLGKWAGDTNGHVEFHGGAYLWVWESVMKFQIGRGTIPGKDSMSFSWQPRQLISPTGLQVVRTFNHANFITVDEIKVGSFTYLMQPVPSEVFSPNAIGGQLRLNQAGPGITFLVSLTNHGDDAEMVVIYLNAIVRDQRSASDKEIRRYKKERKRLNRRKERIRRKVIKPLDWITRHGKKSFYVDIDGRMFEL